VNQSAYELHIPDDLHLERRPVCAPRTDEPLLLRDDAGHVLAVVESVPESQPN
jgi:hypothetical protein